MTPEQWKVVEWYFEDGDNEGTGGRAMLTARLDGGLQCGYDDIKAADITSAERTAVAKAMIDRWTRWANKGR